MSRADKLDYSLQQPLLADEESGAKRDASTADTDTTTVVYRGAIFNPPCGR